MRDDGRAGQMEFVHGVLHHAVGIGDALVLAQVLHPGFDQKRLEHAAVLGGILEHAPGIGAVAAALMLELGDGFEECLRGPAGRMRYSTVTRTGPRSLSMSCDVIGCGQCMEGVRSRPAPVCSFQRHVSGMASDGAGGGDEMREPAARRYAATSPHTALPSVRQPKNTVV